MAAVAQQVTRDANHVYWAGDQRIAGVTAVLEPLRRAEFSRIPAATLERKRDLGTRVHRYCEQLDKGEPADVDDDAHPYVIAYVKWVESMGGRAHLLLNEEFVYCEPKRYAGQLDRLFDIDGAIWVVDLKSCCLPPRSAGPQTAAYAHAYDPTAKIRRAALMLGAEGQPVFRELTDPRDLAVFMACLTIHHYLNGA